MPPRILLTTPIATGGEIVNKIPGYYPPKSIGEIVRLMYWLLPVVGIDSIGDYAELQGTIISIWDFAELFVSNWDFVGI